MIYSRLLLFATLFQLAFLAAADKPNFIVVFVDDQGWADLGSYGSPTIQTPRLDRMADEGIRFTQFYVGSSVCSASRASLLTGRYSVRHGVKGVFFPGRGGMAPSEVTIAEVLKAQGYATAAIGKWHLGDSKKSLPRQQGFDEYFGIPYSNDMFIGPSQRFAKKVVFRQGYNREKALADQAFVKANPKDRNAIKKTRGLADLVPLMRGEEIVEYPANQATLTRRYFDEVISFIDKQAGQPFFVYLTPTMPHVPLFASADFLGNSKRGLYGDTIEEIDWNMGRLLDYLDKNKLSKNTFVIYASDNGPWLGKGQNGGSAGHLRDGKFSNYEGGVRVPGIIRWPGKIPQGVVSDEIVSTIDLLPTIAHYASADLPDKTIDGLNISAFLANPKIKIQRSVIYYLRNAKLEGLRVGDWKYSPVGFAKKNRKSPELFNLKDDPSEKNNLADNHPKKIHELEKILHKFKNSL